MLRMSTISENRARLDGGGLWLGAGTDVVLEVDTVCKNRADRNGGGLFNNSSTIELVHARILLNQGVLGGGVYNAVDEEALQFSSSNILYNQADQGAVAFGPFDLGRSLVVGNSSRSNLLPDNETPSFLRSFQFATDPPLPGLIVLEDDPFRGFNSSSGCTSTGDYFGSLSECDA